MCSNVFFEGDDDRWKWGLERSDIFTVASLRTMLDDIHLKKSGIKTRWNALVPRKVRILFWRTRMDKIPTRENLTKRGCTFDTTACALCNSHSENRDHIFATCPKTLEVRRAINNWWTDAIKEEPFSMQDVFGPDGGNNHTSSEDLIKDAIVHVTTRFLKSTI